MEKMTFDDLVAKKIQKSEQMEKVHEITVDDSGKTLDFKLPEEKITLETIDIIMGNSNSIGVIEGYKKLIYHSCEMLRNPELHKAIGAADPYDVVENIFSLAEIMQIGEELFGMTGMGEVDEKVKN